MKRSTPVLFFVAAALFALSGVLGMFSGDTRRSGIGFAGAVVWLVLGSNLKRKQSARPV